MGSSTGEGTVHAFISSLVLISEASKHASTSLSPSQVLHSLIRVCKVSVSQPANWKLSACKYEKGLVLTHEISMDTEARRIALSQFKGPVVCSGIPNTAPSEAVNVPVDFHMHCREMRPACGTVLFAVCHAGGACELSPRSIVCEVFAVPAIRKVNVVSQAC